MLPKIELKQLYRGGLSIQKIAERKKWPYCTVKYWMERHNISRRSRAEASYYGYWNRYNNGKIISPYKLGKKLTIDKVKNLYYQEGRSAREVGEFFGRPTSSVYRFMKSHNLPRRSAAETNNIAYAKQEPTYRLKKALNFGRRETKSCRNYAILGRGLQEFT